MKPPSTLATQIKQAQRQVSKWPNEVRSLMRLQGLSEPKKVGQH